MIDTLARVETPEGVELEFSPAGPVPRSMAWLLDLFIRIVAYGIVKTILTVAGLGGVGGGLFLIFVFLLEWGYPVLFEVLNQGRTPGKAALGLRVIREDGVPVSWSRSSVRALVGLVDFLPFAYGVGLVAIFLGGRFQRLGDLAAGTVVVHVAPAQPPSRGNGTSPEPAPRLPFPLALVEQRAVMAFSERAPLLTRERAEELANFLEPVTGARGGEGVRRLLALARELKGST